MPSRPRHRSLPFFLRATLATGLAWCIVWIGALHYAPTAHAQLHDDANDADHHCVVEIMHDGILLEPIDVAVHAPSTRLVSVNVAAASSPVTTPTRLRPPGRGPPAV